MNQYLSSNNKGSLHIKQQSHPEPRLWNRVWLKNMIRYKPQRLHQDRLLGPIWVNQGMASKWALLVAKWTTVPTPINYFDLNHFWACWEWSFQLLNEINLIDKKQHGCQWPKVVQSRWRVKLSQSLSILKVMKLYICMTGIQLRLMHHYQPHKSLNIVVNIRLGPSRLQL